MQGTKNDKLLALFVYDVLLFLIILLLFAVIRCCLMELSV